MYKMHPAAVELFNRVDRMNFGMYFHASQLQFLVVDDFGSLVKASPVAATMSEENYNA